ncbi:MAG TPA: GTP cyclohydrolase I, partial [Bacteroidales bacterium]|nr:GTP cyclohydrolase I [Bacteroidales bacterium]
KISGTGTSYRTDKRLHPKHTQPNGGGCGHRAEHMCMQIRGVQKQNSKLVTSAFTGAFLKDVRTREEFMHLLH